MAGQIQNTVECPVAKIRYFHKYLQKILTTVCPASGQKKKEGLGLDMKGGEVGIMKYRCPFIFHNFAGTVNFSPLAPPCGHSMTLVLTVSLSIGVQMYCNYLVAFGFDSLFSTDGALLWPQLGTRSMVICVFCPSILLGCPATSLTVQRTI